MMSVSSIVFLVITASLLKSIWSVPQDTTLPSLDGSDATTPRVDSSVKVEMTLQLPALPEEKMDNSLEQKRQFDPWGGKKRSKSSETKQSDKLKRQFSPWGGKRTSVAQIEHFEGQIIGDRKLLPLKNTVSSIGKRSFHSWGGKRGDFNSRDIRKISEWGNKRNFNAWGGKRSVVEETSPQPLLHVKATPIWRSRNTLSKVDAKRSFNSWGGKRSFSSWGGKREGFNSWGGKRGFNSWGGKRGGFNSWGGKRGGFNSWGGKRDGFNSWGGKRQAFNSWGGKRGGFNSWGGKREDINSWGKKRDGFNSWGGKRGFNSWGGKRSLNTLAEKRNFVPNDENNIAVPEYYLEQVDGNTK